METITAPTISARARLDGSLSSSYSRSTFALLVPSLVLAGGLLARSMPFGVLLGTTMAASVAVCQLNA